MVKGRNNVDGTLAQKSMRCSIVNLAARSIIVIGWLPRTTGTFLNIWSLTIMNDHNNFDGHWVVNHHPMLRNSR
jgi:hypothetical protein